MHQSILQTQGPISEIFVKFFWKLVVLKISVFLVGPFRFFFKKHFFLLQPHENQFQASWLPRMSQSFDDCTGFQSKKHLRKNMQYSACKCFFVSPLSYVICTQQSRKSYVVVRTLKLHRTVGHIIWPKLCNKIWLQTSLNPKYLQTRHQAKCFAVFCHYFGHIKSQMKKILSRLPMNSERGPPQILHHRHSIYIRRWKS